MSSERAGSIDDLARSFEWERAEESEERPQTLGDDGGEKDCHQGCDGEHSEEPPGALLAESYRESVLARSRIGRNVAQVVDHENARPLEAPRERRPQRRSRGCARPGRRRNRWSQPSPKKTNTKTSPSPADA